MTTAAAAPARPWTKFYSVGMRHTIDEAPYPNLAAMVRSVARTYADKPAFSLCLPNGMGGSLTYAEIDRWSDAFAVYLRDVLKLKPGARIALQTPNAMAFPIVAFGVFKAGCVLINVKHGVINAVCGIVRVPGKHARPRRVRYLAPSAIGPTGAKPARSARPHAGGRASHVPRVTTPTTAAVQQESRDCAKTPQRGRAQ